MWNFGKSVKKWKNIETATGKCKKKVGKSEKPGGKWKNFVKVWKVEKFVKMCETLENLSKNEKILAKNGKLENSGKTWWKVTKSEKPGGKWKNVKNLVESGKMWKTWWKVEKCEKPGRKWKNFVKVWKVEKFLTICETLENLSKNEKILKPQKRENWKILEQTWWKVTKSEKLGQKWKNVKNLV